MKTTLDHLIVACRDLDRAVDWVEDRLGVRPAPGGRHPGIGTRNALLSFGDQVYLEVVGVDPEQPEPPRPRWFGLDDLEEPRLVTWCARSSEMAAVQRAASRAGVELGEIRDGGRERTDGAILRWKVSDPWAPRLGGAIPFFIDWMDSPHPGAGEGSGYRVHELRIRHPRPKDVARAFQALGLDGSVKHGKKVVLSATLDTPDGLVELS